MVVGLKHEMSVESGAASVSTGAEEGEEEEEKKELSTNKPAPIALPDDMTAMQIDCGTFHTGTCVHVHVLVDVYMYDTNVLTVLCCVCAAILLHSGEVYVFGHNKHGQLGQGNTKDW